MEFENTVSRAFVIYFFTIIMGSILTYLYVVGINIEMAALILYMIILLTFMLLPIFFILIFGLRYVYNQNLNKEGRYKQLIFLILGISFLPSLPILFLSMPFSSNSSTSIYSSNIFGIFIVLFFYALSALSITLWREYKSKEEIIYTNREDQNLLDDINI